MGIKDLESSRYEKKKKGIFTAIALIALAAMPAMPLALAHAGDDYYSHHEMMSGFCGGIWGMSFFGWISMLLAIVALVLLIAWLIKQLQKK